MPSRLHNSFFRDESPKPNILHRASFRATGVWPLELEDEGDSEGYEGDSEGLAERGEVETRDVGTQT